MRVLFEINHPSRVHNFKNIIWELMRQGNEVKIAAIKKEVTYDLLDAYNLTYEKLGENKPGGLIRKLPLLFSAVTKLNDVALRFKPDVFVSSYSPISAIVSRLHGRKHIAFHDTENTSMTDFVTAPFTDVICTPRCFLKEYGEKQVRFDGYKELCYLHPRYFKPNPRVLSSIGVDEGQPLIFVRLAAFLAHHDVNQHGILKPLDLIHGLEKFGRIILSTEVAIPELQKYVVRFKPEDAHSLLHYSKLYVGDSATMATEAGLLGTPSIYISSFKGTLGNFIELEDRYSLVYSYRTDSEAESMINEILLMEDAKKLWGERRRRMLAETIDVNDFFIKQIMVAGGESV
jgi:uncharacterized protein